MMKNYKSNHRRLWQQMNQKEEYRKEKKTEEERALQEKFNWKWIWTDAVIGFNK